DDVGCTGASFDRGFADRFPLAVVIHRDPLAHRRRIINSATAEPPIALPLTDRPTPFARAPGSFIRKPIGGTFRANYFVYGRPNVNSGGCMRRHCSDTFRG